MKTDHPDATDLADRLEQAVGPDRELDTACAEAMGISLGLLGQSQHYTASVDVALTLIDGVLLHLSDIGGDGLPMAHVANPLEGGGEGKAVARTLPLALCAAAIRCRESSR